MSPSIFFEFTLPNSATWFYFSLFLTVALFFQFARAIALRNWDILALFLFAPGFLLIQEANQLPTAPPVSPTASAERLSALPTRADRERFLGYVWLLSASGYWFTRCLLDLAWTKRPLPSPNLNTPGLVWFGCSLFMCLAAVTFTRPSDPWEPVGKRPVAIAGVEQGALQVVQQTGTATASPAEVRFGVRRSLAAACHVLVVVGLVLIGRQHFGDWATGVAAGTLYLMLPYTAYHIGQVHHVWPAALILWAVYLYRYPTVAGILIGLAAGTTFFPLVVVPAWTQFYRHRGVTRFLGGFVSAGVLSLGITLAIVAAAGPIPDAAWPPLQVEDWQPWRVPTSDSVWSGVHWAYRVPVFIVYAAFVLGTIVWPPMRNMGELAAVTAATLIGVQFWYADRGGLYVLWYAPLLVLLVFRPTTTELQPGAPGPWPRWVRRTAGLFWRRRRSPEPVAA